MATLAKQSTPPSLTRWLRRTAQSVRALFAQGDFTALLIALGLLLMPALSLRAAGWPLAMPTVLPVLLLSLVFGFLLARSFYNELLALFMSVIYGGCFILLIAAINEPGSLGEGAYSVFSRLFKWIIDATTGGINQDDLVFTLLVSGLFWFLGYNIAWHIFRIDRVWRAIVPPGLILVTNSVYYTGGALLDRYLAVYTFLALLLIIRSNLDAREWDWYVNGIRVPRKLRQQIFRMGTILALIALLLGWGIPSKDIQERLNKFQEFLQSEPLTQLSEFWNRLFTAVETQGPTTTDYYGGESLQLGGAIRLGDQTVFIVSAPPGRRYYWRSRVFDSYDRGRWTSAADTRLTDPEIPLDIIYDTSMQEARVLVQQEFTMGLNASRILYAAPQPVRIDLPTRTDLRYVSDQAMNISVIRPLKVLYRGDSYTATSSMSNATASQLRQVMGDYPDWVKQLYLTPPLSATGRTIQLARQIITDAGAVTPYDQTRAIESWLRANITYNERIPQPPPDRDPVDWVVFDLKQGYCNYYASAMVVMLRTLGIPARMAAGFAQGKWDEEQQGYVVLERDAHTWVEVFFPGYGWIEFEPTAAQAPINRGDDTPQFMQPTIPPVSPSPTPSPTPTPTPTAGAPTEPPQPESNLFPTVTPSDTPTPTPTPVIIPTQPPPIRPQNQNPLSLILPAVGLALLAVLFIVLLIALLVFLYWWWEWRGMRGLSPITRAYARLERYISLIGIHFNSRQTPEERRVRMIRDLPPIAEPPVTTITNLYTYERYGPKSTKPAAEAADAQSAEKAWKDARGNILKRYLRKFKPFRRGEG